MAGEPVLDEREDEADAGGPEPGTYEWRIGQGSYVDPEPEWDAGEPYIDHAHGTAFYDTRAGYEAGRVRYPDYRHVAPDPETEPEAG